MNKNCSNHWLRHSKAAGQLICRYSARRCIFMRQEHTAISWLVMVLTHRPARTYRKIMLESQSLETFLCSVFVLVFLITHVCWEQQDRSRARQPRKREKERERQGERERKIERVCKSGMCPDSQDTLHVFFHNAGTFFHPLATTPDAKQAVLTVGGMLLSVWVP